MTPQEARYRLEQRTKQQQAVLFLDALLWFLAFFSATVLAVTRLSGSPGLGAGIALVAGTIAFGLRSRNIGLFAFNQHKLLQLLHRHHKEYEDSGDLLLADETTLTTLQQVQLHRTLARFSAGHKQLAFPHQLKKATLVLTTALLLGLLIYQFGPQLGNKPEEDISPATHTSTGPVVVLPAAIKAMRLQITPPAYTGIKKYTSDTPTLPVPEGSRVQWSLTFSENISSAHIHLTTTDSSALTGNAGNQFTFEKSLYESVIYRFSWQQADASFAGSAYYKIEVIPDQPPTVVMANNLAQFTELSFPAQHLVTLQARLSDDFGLSTASIVATVSKGSGESVKFREEKIAFTQPAQISGKVINATRTIDLRKLGMEPGDELYFYAEVIDNKVPMPNKARTETYFVSLKDTTRQDVSVEAGLGVDLMPDYFRSQRQIIIDTEKLLRNRKKITRQQFNATSNELGYDQKVLRLKYGEFLGEEAESGIGVHGSPAEDDGGDDVTKKYGHAHDTENEHNLVPEKKPEAKETHHHEHADEPGKEESPLEAFAHNHDNAEEATFFVQSIRAKLKAALTVMWDAELQLRLYEPEKSLPFQYQALKLLKEISNDSRVYVHRTGFDPPPIKEDRRLKGDLAETKSTTGYHHDKHTESLPAIRQSIAVLERLLDKPGETLTSQDRALLQQAGNELAAVALKQPGQHFRSLSALQALLQGKTENRNTSLLLILKSFWQAIPGRAPSPSLQTQPWHSLDRKFVDNLNTD